MKLFRVPILTRVKLNKKTRIHVAEENSSEPFEPNPLRIAVSLRG